MVKEKPEISNAKLAEIFKISPPTAKRYREWSKEKIASLDRPKVYDTKPSWYSPYSNILYKMARDGYSNRMMFLFLVQELEGEVRPRTIQNYLNRFLMRIFPDVPRSSSYDLFCMGLPDDITTIKRRDLCKWLFSGKTTQIQKDQIELIKKEYPIVDEINEIYSNFHSVLMGNRPELLDDYLEAYEESLIQKFCEELKKDIAAIHRAISSGKNSGWVEGLNTKFKLIKRILYGRAKIVNLEKKFRLALHRFKDGERIFDLLKKPN